MTSNPAATDSVSDVMDSFAMVAMEQLIPLYAPEHVEGPGPAMEWSKQIAVLSYTMAATMMNTRARLCAEMADDLQGENENAA